MSDIDMSENDDEYQMEYTSESDSEPDVDLENQVQFFSVTYCFKVITVLQRKKLERKRRYRRVSSRVRSRARTRRRKRRMGLQGAEAKDKSQLQTQATWRDARILQNAAWLHQKLGDAKLLRALDKLDFGLHFCVKKYEVVEGILRTDAGVAKNCEK